MKFAILLPAVLTLACVFGSVIPQGGTLDEYLGAYGERGGALIVGLCLDDVFHSAWFLVLTVLLVCDLLYCNLIRLPSLFSRMKRFRDPQTAWRLSEAAQAFDEAGTPAGEEAEPKPARRRQEPALCTLKQVPDAAAVFETLHMKPVSGERAGRKTLFAAQNSVGLCGAWVTHLGILLLIVGVTLGQTTRQLYTVHGVPGQTLPVGDTGCTLTINDFDVSLTDSGVASQFTSDVTMRDPAGATESAVVSVNRPGDLFGVTNEDYYSSYNELYLIYRGTVTKGDEAPYQMWFPVHFLNILSEADSMSYEEICGIGAGWSSSESFTNPVSAWNEIMDYGDSMDWEAGGGFERFETNEKLDSLSKIGADQQTSFQEMAKAEIESYLADAYSFDSTVSELTYAGEILLTPKDEYYSNRLCVVFSAEVTSEDESFEKTTVYYPVRYDDISVIADGECFVDYKNGIAGYSYELSEELKQLEN